MGKKYLIVYKTAAGFGNAYFTVDSDEDIYTEASIEVLKDSLEIKLGGITVVIQNIIPLNG